jgi:hypothetical protein
LTPEEIIIQNNTTGDVLKSETTENAVECLKEVISCDIDAKIRNKILDQVKEKFKQISYTSFHPLIYFGKIFLA